MLPRCSKLVLSLSLSPSYGGGRVREQAACALCAEFVRSFVQDFVRWFRWALEARKRTRTPRGDRSQIVLAHSEVALVGGVAALGAKALKPAPSSPPASRRSRSYGAVAIIVTREQLEEPRARAHTFLVTPTPLPRAESPNCEPRARNLHGTARLSRKSLIPLCEQAIANRSSGRPA
jgi:hypothetical protein